MRLESKQDEDPSSFGDERNGAAGLRPRNERSVQIPKAAILIASLIVVALLAGLFWGADRNVSPPLPAANPELPATTTSAARPAAEEMLVVHVAGAVLQPGVVRVPKGSRIIDAIDAAGGPGRRADLDRLNLAAPVADGDRVTVAAIGDPRGVSVTNPSVPAEPGVGAPGTPVNLNTATGAELETLPGIGPALAAAIIAERERRGGFSAVEQLRDVRGIGEARFAQLRDLVVV